MELQDFFKEHDRVAIAFSGGTDSAYLLYAARRHAKACRAYFVKSDFQPQFELDDARRLAGELDVPLTVIKMHILDNKQVIENTHQRCYFCKRQIFSAIREQAVNDGFTVLLDGTNASDDAGDRPGMVALSELAVLSPLRLCGLTKAMIRERSKAAGLFTWDKPAYACLATRIPFGTPLDKHLLVRTEQAENFLMSLGFKDFRIRTLKDSARIQLPVGQMEHLLRHRTEILAQLKPAYDAVLLDLEARDE